MSTLQKKLPVKRKRSNQEGIPPHALNHPQLPEPAVDDRPQKRRKTERGTTPADTPTTAKIYATEAQSPTRKRTEGVKATHSNEKRYVEISQIEVSQEENPPAPASVGSPPIASSSKPCTSAVLAAPNAFKSNVTASNSPQSEPANPMASTTSTKSLHHQRLEVSKKNGKSVDRSGFAKNALSTGSPFAAPQPALPAPGFTNRLPVEHDVKPVVIKLLTGKLQWPLKPVPTPPQDGPCPIDWTQAPYKIVDSNYPVWKDAYLWRQPWTKKPPSFVECGGMYMRKHKKSGAPKDYEETVRKQFMKLNLLIFLETGHYYAGSTSGLKNLVPEANETLKQQSKEEKKPAEGTHGNECGGEGNLFNITWEEMLDYGREEFTFCSLEDTDGETPKFHTRFAPISLVRSEFPHLEASIDQNVNETDLDYEVDIVDGLINCVWPFKHVVPPTILNCPIKHGGERAWQVSRIVWTAGKTIQLYCLAKELGSSYICDMAATQLYRIYKEEVKYRYELRTGARKFNDVPSGFVSVLDFEPDDVNKLWELTEQDDQMRTLWLNIIRAKAYNGIAKLDEEFELYSAQVIQAVESKYQTHMTLADLRKRIAIGYGNVLEVPKPDLEYDDTPHGGRTGVARSYNHLCSLTKEEFCGQYHKHTHLDLPCHLETPAPAIPLDNDLVPEKSGNRVTMTIDGIKGFTIINHCPFSNEHFRQLPELETEWDWERVRLVNFHNVSGQHYITPYARPSYFADHEKDQMGRYPSHPGYNNPWWNPEIENPANSVAAAAYFKPMAQGEFSGENQLGIVMEVSRKPISLLAHVQARTSNENQGQGENEDDDDDDDDDQGATQKSESEESGTGTDSDSYSDSTSEEDPESGDEQIQTPGAHTSDVADDIRHQSPPKSKIKAVNMGNGAAGTKNLVKGGRVQKKRLADNGRPHIASINRQEISRYREYLLQGPKETMERDTLVADQVYLGNQPSTRPEYDDEMEWSSHGGESSDDGGESSDDDGSSDHHGYDDELL